MTAQLMTKISQDSSQEPQGMPPKQENLLKRYNVVCFSTSPILLKIDPESQKTLQDGFQNDAKMAIKVAIWPILTPSCSQEGSNFTPNLHLGAIFARSWREGCPADLQNRPQSFEHTLQTSIYSNCDPKITPKSEGPAAEALAIKLFYTTAYYTRLIHYIILYIGIYIYIYIYTYIYIY